MDNDARGSSRSVFDSYASRFAGGSRYVLEPQRGYSNARNAVLRNIGEADHVVFIDDDEVPTRGWLDHLRDVQTRTGAEVVVGPVISEFPVGAPPWFEESGVFGAEAPDLEEGAAMPWCATNNTLVTRSVLDRVPEGFDPRFNSMSGEDTYFFLSAHVRGSRILWTRGAPVLEYLPHSRLSRQWILRRAMRSGNTRALAERELLGGFRIVAFRFAKVAALLTMGLFGLALAASRGDRARRLRAVHQIGLAVGMILAYVQPAPWDPSAYS